MKGGVHVVALATMLGIGAPAVAQELEVQFREGRVTVIATDVTLGEILDEWSRVGGTRIVDADKLSAPPLRLRLVDVPESEALKILLRGVPGYLAAPGAATGDGSRFDRVVVMATGQRPRGSVPQVFASSPSAPVPVQQAPGSQFPGVPGGLTPDAFELDFPDDDLEELREILPQPFSLIDNADQDVDPFDREDPTMPTATRPGVVVAPNDDQSPVFIRRPVRPQTPDGPRR